MVQSGLKHMRRVCNVCGSTKIQDYSRAGKDYPLKQCLNCKLVFSPSLGNNKENIYSENYYLSQEIKGGYFNYFEESITNKLTFKYRLKRISSYKHPARSRLLDFGCALGDFLEVAKSLMWKNAQGVDISDFAARECRKKGLKVSKINGGQQDNHLKERSYDVITLQDVIEHFSDPYTEMRKIYGLLKPGGLIFVTTPKLDSFSEKLLGRNWYHYKKGEHLFYFNPQNIQLLLGKTGFSNIKVKQTASWVTAQYIINRLQYYFPKLLKGPVNGLFKNPLFHIAFPIYAGEMEIWAEKPDN